MYSWVPIWFLPALTTAGRSRTRPRLWPQDGDSQGQSSSNWGSAGLFALSLSLYFSPSPKHGKRRHPSVVFWLYCFLWLCSMYYCCLWCFVCVCGILGLLCRKVSLDDWLGFVGVVVFYWGFMGLGFCFHPSVARFIAILREALWHPFPKFVGRPRDMFDSTWMEWDVRKAWMHGTGTET